LKEAEESVGNEGEYGSAVKDEEDYKATQTRPTLHPRVEFQSPVHRTGEGPRTGPDCNRSFRTISPGYSHQPEPPVLGPALSNYLHGPQGTGSNRSRTELSVYFLTFNNRNS